MGAAGTASGSDGAWQLLLNGPGGFTATGWGANAGTWFATSGAGVSISNCTAGASCGPSSFGSPPAIGSGQVSGDGSALSAPAVWTLDPEDPTRMLVATCRVWRGAADGTGWTAANTLSRMLDGNNAPVCQSSNTQVRALAASGAISGRGDQAERIYVGLAGVPEGSLAKAGHVWTALVTPSSVATSTTWSDLTGQHGDERSNGFRSLQPGGGGRLGDRGGCIGYDGEDGVRGNCRLRRPGICAAAVAERAGVLRQHRCGSPLAEPDEPPAECAGECGAGGSRGSGNCVCGDRCRSVCHDVDFTMRRREPGLLERLRRRVAGGAGNDAERGRCEWREVAACGDERTRRVAGRTGQPGAEEHHGNRDDWPGDAELCLTGGGHRERRGESDDSKHGCGGPDAGCSHGDEQRFRPEQPVPGEPGGGGLMRDLDCVCADGDGATQRGGDGAGECAGRRADGQCAGRGHAAEHHRADPAAAGFWIGAHRADEPGAIRNGREYRQGWSRD